MAPPRVPLHALKGFTNQLPSTTPDSASKMQSTLAPSMGSTGSKSTGSGVTQPVPPELMAEFKKAIDGSDLTKAGLVEVLKKR